MRLPAGVRDWLPEELRRKREIEQWIHALFAELGYAEVETPSMERVDTLAAGLGDRVAGKTFHFEDRKGAALALRPEMTTSIARLVATRMQDRPLPLRLCYIAHAFRFEEPQEGRMREFTQAGLEYVGESTPQADAEAVLTAMHMLECVGLRDARIDINHVAVVDGVLATAHITGDKATEVKLLLARRDIVALEALLADRDPSVARAILDLALARGCHELIERLRPYCMSADAIAGLERLSFILHEAEQAGYGERVCVDFALVRELGYYTGLVFEGYLGALGFPLCGGGRYDGLLPRFGYETGAIGWATGIERLIIARERAVARKVPGEAVS